MPAAEMTQSAAKEARARWDPKEHKTGEIFVPDQHYTLPSSILKESTLQEEQPEDSRWLRWPAEQKTRMCFVCKI